MTSPRGAELLPCITTQCRRGYIPPIHTLITTVCPRRCSKWDRVAVQAPSALLFAQESIDSHAWTQSQGGGLQPNKLEIIALLTYIRCVLHKGLSGLCCTWPNLCKASHAATWARPSASSAQLGPANIPRFPHTALGSNVASGASPSRHLQTQHLTSFSCSYTLPEAFDGRPPAACMLCRNLIAGDAETAGVRTPRTHTPGCSLVFLT